MTMESLTKLSRQEVAWRTLQDTMGVVRAVFASALYALLKPLGSRVKYKNYVQHVLSETLTWSLKGGPLKRTVMSKGLVLRFRVSFPECI